MKRVLSSSVVNNPPEKCVIFINDAPDITDKGVEAGLKYAEEKGLFVVAHWRTKQNGRYLVPEDVLEKVCAFVLRRPDIKHLLLMHCNKHVDQDFLMDKIIQLTYTNDVDVKELWVLDDLGTNPL